MGYGARMRTPDDPVCLLHTRRVRLRPRWSGALVIGAILGCACLGCPPGGTAGQAKPSQPRHVSCAQVRCAAGTRCVEVGGNARCKAESAGKPAKPADQPGPGADPGTHHVTCAQVRCAAGTQCVEVGGNARCQAQPEEGDEAGKGRGGGAPR